MGANEFSGTLCCLVIRARGVENLDRARDDEY